MALPSSVLRCHNLSRCHHLYLVPRATVGAPYPTALLLFLWPPYLIGGHYIFALWFLSSIYLSSFFFLAWSQRPQIGCLPYFYTWRGPSANLEFRMQVWNVLHAARCKYRTQKSRQKSPSGHHLSTLSGYIFVTKACIDNRKKTS